MSTDTHVRLLASMMASAVFFGIAAIAILSVPALVQHAETLLPAAIVSSFILGGAAGWHFGPQMRARYWRHHEHEKSGSDEIDAPNTVQK